jgi:rubrerythrin
VEFLRDLRKLAGCDLRDAKGVLLHLSRPTGECHACGHTIATETVQDCPSCGALNISIDVAAK